jgi:hypothetical protein
MLPALLFLAAVWCVVRVIERVLGAPHEDRPAPPAPPTPAPNVTPYRTAATPATAPESPEEEYVPEPVARWSPGAALVLTWLAGTAILVLLYGFSELASQAARHCPRAPFLGGESPARVTPCNLDHASAR